jgi:effector-binding domain-containing protein
VIEKTVRWAVPIAGLTQPATPHTLRYSCATALLEDSEVGVELDGPFAGLGEVVSSATPDDVVVTAVHLGPYDRLHEAHDAIRQWCTNHGYSLAGPNWEVYGHWKEDWNRDPAQIRTDVYYLLKSDAGSAG